MLFCPVLAKLHPRRTLDSFPGLTPTPHSLSPNSFICHTSENSPLSPNIATLPKTGASNPCVCHTSEAPGGSPVPELLHTLRCSFHSLHKECFTTPLHSRRSTLFLKTAGVYPNSSNIGTQPTPAASPIPHPLSPSLFTKLSFRHPRTYLQEPAPRRPGGIQPCPTVTGVSSPRPLSSQLQLFSSRRWAPWRNPPPPRQVPANQLHPYPRTAGCTSASSAPTPRARLSALTSPSNSLKRFSPPSTRNASMMARSRSTTRTSMTSTSAPSSKPSAPPRTASLSPYRAMIVTFASPSRATT